VALSLLPESVIEERPCWTLAVNRKPGLLGKTMLVLQRHCDAVIDIAPDEWALLRDELRRIVPALDRLFHPDQFNFAFSWQSLTWMPDDRPLVFVPGAAPALGATRTELR
jgi:diadenosine tetraphosphate (Ap4A) HIT family hydrolase